MSEEKKEKEGYFDPRCVADIYDKLSGHNYALRAFAALLKSSDFNELSDDSAGELSVTHSDHPCNLRWGLAQIIELCIDHQEGILMEYVDQYHKSDYELVRRSKSIIGMMDQGAFATKNAAINELREAIGNLDIVINRGGEFKEKAEELKNCCMDYIKQMTEKAKVSG